MTGKETEIGVNVITSSSFIESDKREKEGLWIFIKLLNTWLWKLSVLHLEASSQTCMGLLIVTKYTCIFVQSSYRFRKSSFSWLIEIYTLKKQK